MFHTVLKVPNSTALGLGQQCWPSFGHILLGVLYKYIRVSPSQGFHFHKASEGLAVHQRKRGRTALGGPPLLRTGVS